MQIFCLIESIQDILNIIKQILMGDHLDKNKQEAIHGRNLTSEVLEGIFFYCIKRVYDISSND